MNWEAVGAVGEILGAGTVVATLFYLARQVRHATAVSRAASRQAIAQMNIDTWAPSLDPQVLATAASKPFVGEEMTPEESGNYIRWILMRMRFLENAHYQYREGLLDEAEWRGYASLIKTLVGPDSRGEEVWARGSLAYSPLFVREVERIQMAPDSEVNAAVFPRDESSETDGKRSSSQRTAAQQDDEDRREIAD